MLRRTRTINASPERVWDVLSDGWLYPLWMVGATAMHRVDPTWPAAGAELRHLSGTWPLALDQRTEVLTSNEGSLLTLHVHSQLIGDSRIELTVRPAEDGTEVTLRRDLVAGIRKLVPGPLKEPILKAWADDSLERLSFLAERRP